MVVICGQEPFWHFKLKGIDKKMKVFANFVSIHFYITIKLSASRFQEVITIQRHRNYYAIMFYLTNNLDNDK